MFSNTSFKNGTKMYFIKENSVTKKNPVLLSIKSIKVLTESHYPQTKSHQFTQPKYNKHGLSNISFKNDIS